MSHPLTSLECMEFTGASTTSTAPADAWRAAADSAMAIVASMLTDAPFGPAADAIQDYRDTLTAVEALLIAQRKKAGHSDRANEGVMKKSGRVSKGEAKRRTKRAAAVEKNPELATKLTTGSLSTEKVDLLADASDKTDGAAATDAALIDEVSNANPDQAKVIVRRFVDDHTSANDRDSRYAWQRRRRKVMKTRTNSGMSAIIIEGDNESIDIAFRKIRERADRMYKADGGRDVASDDHQRSYDQRMYDAAMQHLGHNAPSTTSATPQTETSGDGDSGAVPTTASSPPTARPAPKNRPSNRPTMVFVGKVSEITDDPTQLLDWECELIATGRVPEAVAAYYRCISDHAGSLLSDDGEVLWQGRSKRMVTRGQWIALVVRDGGCTLCGDDPSRCEAHHLKPWNAPVKGETNIDELAMVCTDCHHRIHDNHQTLFFDIKLRQWRLRAATPDEIPPDRQRAQFDANTTASRSSEPSGSRPADSSASVNAR